MSLLQVHFMKRLPAGRFLFMLLVGTSFNLGTSMLGTLGYYATVYYVCGGDTTSGNYWNFWMGLAFMFGGLIGAPILNRVAYFLGKRNAMIVTAFIGIAAYASSWYLYTPAYPVAADIRFRSYGAYRIWPLDALWLNMCRCHRLR